MCVYMHIYIYICNEAPRPCSGPSLGGAAAPSLGQHRLVRLYDIIFDSLISTYINLY